MLVCAGLLASLVSPVLAHSQLESATPGPGDKVIGSPTEIVAQFSQDLDPSRTSLEVRDSSGARIARGGVLGDSPREFRLELPELTPGTYEVRWTSYSTEDKEIGRDTYTFEVAAAPSPSPTPSPSASQRPSAPPSPTTPPATVVPSGSPVPEPDTSGTASAIDAAVIVPIAVALALVGVFGVWMLRRPRG